jgi:hypothetical protein
LFLRYLREGISSIQETHSRLSASRSRPPPRPSAALLPQGDNVAPIAAYYEAFSRDPRVRSCSGRAARRGAAQRCAAQRRPSRAH